VRTAFILAILNLAFVQSASADWVAVAANNAPPAIPINNGTVPNIVSLNGLNGVNGINGQQLPLWAQNDQLLRQAWLSKDASVQEMLLVQLSQPAGIASLGDPQFRANLARRLTFLAANGNRPRAPKVVPLNNQITEANTQCLPCQISQLQSQISSLQQIPQRIHPEVVPLSSSSNSGFQNNNSMAQIMAMLSMMSQPFGQSNPFQQNQNLFGPQNQFGQFGAGNPSQFGQFGYGNQGFFGQTAFNNQNWPGSNIFGTAGLGQMGQIGGLGGSNWLSNYSQYAQNNNYGNYPRYAPAMSYGYGSHPQSVYFGGQGGYSNTSLLPRAPMVQPGAVQI
jgi:hypothetical protein